ncbi:Ribosome-binding ATPase YchF [Balamuthia mandrillaris]
MVNQLKQYVASKQGGHAENVVIASAKLESEVANLEDESARAEFLSMYGLTETGLPKVIRAARRMLKQNTYFTVGPQEAGAGTCRRERRRWRLLRLYIPTLLKDSSKQRFTISYDDYIKYGGEKGAKDNARLRFEGASYIVQDGDVLFFRFRK